MALRVIATALVAVLLGSVGGAYAQSRFEAGEDRPGGAATSNKQGQNANAFSHPSGNLGLEDKFKFEIGNGLFRKLWVSSPASTKSSDGLGPLYNARACQRCHLKDGRGHPPAGPQDNFVSMLFRLGVPPSSHEEKRALRRHRANTIAAPRYGSQLQDFAVQGLPAEAMPSVRYEEVPVRLNGGQTVMLRKPTYGFGQLAHGPLSPQTMVSPRIANQMIGLGLLEGIPASSLAAREDPGDADGDGISGRANLVWSVRQNKVLPGRFGWKAGQPTVRQQAAAAFFGDMGLSTTLFRAGWGDCVKTQLACQKAPHGGGLDGAEVTDQMLDLVTFYATNLAVPKRTAARAAATLEGKALFYAAGCASCHTPRHVTSSDQDVPLAHRGQTIWPYTDLLLHDLGPGLADGLTEGAANGREWRTPPLWGIGHTKAVSNHTFFLHDGRARNLLEAILWHSGEAEMAKRQVVRMKPGERARLLAFLNSL